MQDKTEKYFLKILPTLNESQARWFVAKEALSLGRGGIEQVHKLTGFSRSTIRVGIKELQSRNKLQNGSSIRKKGGGRESIIDKYPELNNKLDQIMEESTAGDPMSPLKWTNKSCSAIADELKKSGFQISENTVRTLLQEKDYTLQSNSKSIERVSSHEDRDSQFKVISKTVTSFQEAGSPVISVDSKKKERIGNFKNEGETWRKSGDSLKVSAYDFDNLSDGKAVPYGTYDVKKNEGFVNVGMSADTAQFAVESIRQWWNHVGKDSYVNAKKILICADGGGSNSSRNRSWKYELQKLADEIKLDIHVCHYPPGTSKWNKIEHRMFSYISMNWRGKPLVDFETVVNLIGNTRTKQGLKIKSVLDQNVYEKGVKISDDQFEKINLTYGSENPKWNYAIGIR